MQNSAFGSPDMAPHDLSPGTNERMARTAEETLANLRAKGAARVARHRARQKAAKQSQGAAA